jgi:hypothetical protein
MTKKPKPGPGKPKAKPIVLGRALAAVALRGAGINGSGVSREACITLEWNGNFCMHECGDSERYRKLCAANPEDIPGTLQFVPDVPKPKRGRR